MSSNNINNRRSSNASNSNSSSNTNTNNIAEGTTGGTTSAIRSRTSRNKVLTEMKNKYSISSSHQDPNHTSNHSSNKRGDNHNKTTTPASSTSIVDRLQACLENDKIKDLELIGQDGIRVPALRCVLGSASPVLERMLYGDFAEAKRATIEMGFEDCSHKALQALVEFCCSDQLNISLWEEAEQPEMSWNERMHDLVALAKLGHTYEILNLQETVQDYILPRIQEEPALACAVFNAAHPLPTPELYKAALEIIQAQPYVALKGSSSSSATAAVVSALDNNNGAEAQDQDQEETANTGGGIVCLCPEKLEEVLQDRDIEADELFLFECLLEWKAYNEDLYDNIMDICEQVVRHFRFACIDPRDLKDIVLPSGLVSNDILLDAFMEQAVAASEEGGLTFAAFRGPRGPEGQQDGHVLVQGAGHKGCNGIYTQHQKDVNNHPLLYYIKPDKTKGITYYLIKDRTESWKICENTTALYVWKAYNQVGKHQSRDFPQTGWSLASPTSSGALPSAKVKLPVPTCKFFRPRDKMSVKPIVPPSVANGGAVRRKIKSSGGVPSNIVLSNM